jgi:hypothetical protein
VPAFHCQTGVPLLIQRVPLVVAGTRRRKRTFYGPVAEGCMGARLCRAEPGNTYCEFKKRPVTTHIGICGRMIATPPPPLPDKTAQSARAGPFTEGNAFQHHQIRFSFQLGPRRNSGPSNFPAHKQVASLL